MNFFGYRIPEDVSCECCNSTAVDINHIEARGMGGNPGKDKDSIVNLMAMCRICHIKYGDVPNVKNMLRLIHLKYIKYNGLKLYVMRLVPEINTQIMHLEMDIILLEEKLTIKNK